jgi:hypothetical protein
MLVVQKCFENVFLSAAVVVWLLTIALANVAAVFLVVLFANSQRTLIRRWSPRRSIQMLFVIVAVF